MLQRKFKKGKDCLGPRWEGASVKVGRLAVGMWEVVSVFKQQGEMKAGTQPTVLFTVPPFIQGGNPRPHLRFRILLHSSVKLFLKHPHCLYRGPSG